MPDLTALIGQRIAAHHVEVHDIQDQLDRAWTYPLLRPESWRYTAVHYSASQRGVRSLAGDIESWQGHARYHVRKHRWPAIAYAIGVSQSGRVFLLRDIMEMGYHAWAANAQAIGTCADMGEQAPTAALLRGYAAILTVLHDETPELPHVARETTYGHRELTFLDDRNVTDCPGSLLHNTQRYRAGADFDGGGTMPDPNDEALERLWLLLRDKLGEKRVPGAGKLERPWGGDKVLLTQKGALAARDGKAWDITEQLFDDLVSHYLPGDGSLVLYGGG